MAAIYTGRDARIWLWSGLAVTAPITHSNLAISDFSLTLSKDTLEQELVGEIGNYFIAGGLTAEGSLTACKLHSTAVGKLIQYMINSTPIVVSGQCGAEALHFYFKSCQISGFDFTINTAGDISEGTVDFTILYPYAISEQRLSAYKVLFIKDSLI